MYNNFNLPVGFVPYTICYIDLYIRYPKKITSKYNTTLTYIYYSLMPKMCEIKQRISPAPIYYIHT